MRALEEEGFSLEIKKVIKISEEFELRNWIVETRFGKRQFQTRLSDWPEAFDSGYVVIRDVSGDLYTIEDLSVLDKKSREEILAYVD